MGKLILVVLILILTPFILVAQQPEPTQFTTVYTAEICWGTLTSTSIWTPLPVETSIVNGTANAIHHYLSKLGQQLWEAPLTSDPLNSQKLLITFDMTKDMIPQDNFNFHFYRIRIIQTTKNQVLANGTYDDTVTIIVSLVSEWVVIYEKKAIGKPIRSATLPD